MSDLFRDLLRKIGSGPHTGKNLTRAEAAAATQMMLRQEATPAQIGAFMIAHRIKRPTGEELAGMLDAYDALGPKLKTVPAAYPTLVMSLPYDGRSRTAPISPLTALILAAADCPVVMHGGDRMPTKYGIPLVEVWQGLGVDWTQLTLAQVQQVFETTRLGLVYIPTHFPLAAGLVPYRDQIGKRPPFATLELFWCPYQGDAVLASGFVHPPTEGMAQEAFALRGVSQYITVKGLEGSCDLPRDRTCIIGIGQADAEFERLLLHPRDYGFADVDVPLGSTPELIAAMQAVLKGQPNQEHSGGLFQSAVWNGGFYLWRCGVCSTLEAGLAQAKALLQNGTVFQTLAALTASVSAIALDSNKTFAGTNPR
ncbi:anthranilate phosphoribosyltransferase family protein [Oculatella sp. LEGE 06141]|uniref:anthranilate phosphoribosyltransferase family protein n=1 Tax=Oculatella sp. LEGE 06141 TaxID=1828648 RepID=UPI001882BE9A|nr:anthranilate phosphoribosyltransferase family protein [Oculatella sp. LEGE 06141]MBE9178435.1 anthranilate phosphoribosyltransferase family protein [Oculatella sp. LEGE 06141]